MQESALKELLKNTEKPDLISFGGGFPNAKAFPISDVEEIVKYILKNYGAKALQYGSTEGVEELRDLISMRLKTKYNMNADKVNIITTNGSQSGLYLVSKIFLDRKDYVISEAPTYVGAITAFNAQDPSWLAINIEDDGMDLNLLEHSIKIAINENKPPKFIYVNPTFQNPTGITWAVSKRKELLEIASKYNLIIFEDDPYSEIRFSGSPVPAIKSLDSEDRVIYLGTFSKVLSPGIRLGYIFANEAIVKKLALLKQGVDLCTNVFSQYLAIEYLKRGIIDKQIPIIIELYKKKRDILLESLETYMPAGTKWTRPDGGMFLWITMDKKIDTEKMLQQAIKQKVAYVTGSAFYPDGRGKNSMRLNFTYSKDEDIVEGIKRLSKIVKENL
ncbi:MAG: PLP-dependent aminotransferase family protein [Candidatus Micrarchaeaceae archaeon]